MHNSLTNRDPQKQSITPIKIYGQNYVWCIQKADKAWLVDPGLDQPVLEYLNSRNIELVGIIITHAHWDHITGIPGLVKRYPQIPVYGPSKAAIPYQTHQLKHNDSITVFTDSFTIIETPGHTQDHICLISQALEKPLLFCGDTLFSLGCGRTFSGTAQQLYQSICTLAELPPDTLVYCTHEYTRNNLSFARQVEPQNCDLDNFEQQLERQETGDTPSLPTTIREQLRYNPFMRCHEPGIAKAVRHYAASQNYTTPQNYSTPQNHATPQNNATPQNHAISQNIATAIDDLNPEQVFTLLRQWKDSF